MQHPVTAQLHHAIADPDADLAALESQARRRAGAKLGWLIHAAAYVCVNLFLAALAAQHGKGWAIYPALGWGVGLLVHGAAVWLGTSTNGLYGALLERERAALQTAQSRHDPKDPQRR